MYVILTSKPGHYRTETGADFRSVEAFDYEFCGRVRARFVIAELLRDSRMRIVDESELPTVNDVPTKFLQKFASADAARTELQQLAGFAAMDIRLVPRALPGAAATATATTVCITFAPAADKTVQAPTESNLLRVSLREGGGIPFKCGAGLCGTCRCHIEGGPQALDAVKAKERKHLSDAELAAGWRMACQTFVRGDVCVRW